MAAARLAESRDEPEGVVAVVRPPGRGPALGDCDEGIVGWRAMYAEALAAVGRVEDAAEMVAWLADDVGTAASAAIRTDLARARIAVALAAGDVACADEDAVRGLEIVDEPAVAFSRGRLELVAGGHVAAARARSTGPWRRSKRPAVGSTAVGGGALARCGSRASWPGRVVARPGAPRWRPR